MADRDGREREVFGALGSDPSDAEIDDLADQMFDAIRAWHAITELITRADHGDEDR